MIELHTWNTPNGRKISVALEEMGLPYAVKPVDISKGQQFDPHFLSFSPNNRIPAIIDPEGPGGQPITVFESGAILLYLAEKTGRFMPRDLRARVPVYEWLMWQMGGFGPMPGQVHHFLQQPDGPAKEYGFTRYHTETKRLYGVLDKRLRGRDFFRCSPCPRAAGVRHRADGRIVPHRIPRRRAIARCEVVRRRRTLVKEPNR